MAKNGHQKVPKSDFQSQFPASKIVQIFLKKISLKNINLGAHFFFLLILYSIKIERLLFLKFLKILAFFDSYFWPFNKSEEKNKVIFVISVIMPSIWNVFIKFRWHDEKLTFVPVKINLYISLNDGTYIQILNGLYLGSISRHTSLLETSQERKRLDMDTT